MAIKKIFFSKNIGESKVSQFLYSISGKKRDEYMILSYFDKQIKLKKSAGSEGIATAYRSTQNSIAQFLNSSDIRIYDIDYIFIQNYRQYLLSKGVCHNTISFYMRNFRTIYNNAILEGHITDKENPFQHIKIKMHKTLKRSLNTESLRKIAKMQLKNKSKLEMARDLFMFSFYTRGMSFVDIAHLKRTNIYDGVIHYQRNKTHQWIKISLTEPLEKLINKYKNDSPYVFPILNSESKIPIYSQYKQALRATNRRLKRIADMLEIDTPLTTYVARHSWATLAKEWGAPIAVISEGLGHTSEKTTQIYLKEFDRSILDQVNDGIFKTLE